MIVRIDKCFVKDVEKISDTQLLSKIADCIERIILAPDISSISSLKRMKGGNSFFRIRIGNYRIGMKINNDIVILIRFLHRKDIYRYFP